MPCRNDNPDGFGPRPLTFKLGADTALPGLEEGIVGMRKGEIRRVIVPAALGYSKFPGLEPVPVNKIGQSEQQLPAESPFNLTLKD